jgi:hypothetical protein
MHFFQLAHSGVKRIRCGFARKLFELRSETLYILLAGYRTVLFWRILRTGWRKSIAKNGEGLRTTNAAFLPVDRQVMFITQVEIDAIDCSTGFAFFREVQAKVVCIADILHSCTLQFLVQLIQQDV